MALRVYSQGISASAQQVQLHSKLLQSSCVDISRYAELCGRCMWLGTASGPPVRCWLLWQSTEH